MAETKPFPGIGDDYNGPPMTMEIYHRLEADWYRVQDAEQWEHQQPPEWTDGRSEGNLAAHRQHQLLATRIKDALEQVGGITVQAASQQIGAQCEMGSDGVPVKLDLGGKLGSLAGDVLAWCWANCAAGYDRRTRAVLDLLEGISDFGAQPDMGRLAPPKDTGARSDEANDVNKEVFERLMAEAVKTGRGAEAARASLAKYPNRQMILPFVAASSKFGTFTIHLDGALLPVITRAPGFTDAANVQLCQFLRHLALVARRERAAVIDRAVKDLPGFDGLRPGAPDTGALLEAPEIADWPPEERDAQVARERWLADLKTDVRTSSRGKRRPV